MNYIVAKTTGFLSTGSGSAQFQVGSVPGAGTGSSKTGGTAGPATNGSGSIGPASNPVSDVLGTLGIAGLVIGLFALMLAFAFMI